MSHRDHVEVRSFAAPIRRPLLQRLARVLTLAVSPLLLWSSVGFAGTSSQVLTDTGSAFLAPVAVTARIEVGTQPGSLAVGTDDIWVVVGEGLVRVDPATNQVVKHLTGPELFAYAFAAATPDALFVQQGGVSTTAPLEIVRIDHATGQAIGIAAYEYGPHGIAVGFGSIWAIDIGGTVTRVDPQTGSVSARIHLDGPAWGIDVAQGSVWVAGAEGLYRIDPETNAVVATVGVLNATDVAVTDNLIWVTGMTGGVIGPNLHTVFSIQPSTNQIIHRTLVEDAVALAAGDHVVWVVTHVGGELVGLDPLTGLVGQRIEIGTLLADVRVVGGTIWVAQGGTDGDLFRLE